MIKKYIGWFGALLILLSFLLLSIGKLNSTQAIFYGINFFGGLGLTIEGYLKKSYSSMTLNLFYTIVAIIGFLRLII